MLIPLAAAWRDVAGATGPEQGLRRAKLKRWFWCASFTGEYESSSASLAEGDAPRLREWLTGGSEPPVVASFAWSPDRWRTTSNRQQGLYKATIAAALTDHPRDLHTAAPLTRDLIDANQIDDDHVFQRAYLRETDRASEPDTVLNHCLIDRTTNASIGKKAPSVYLGAIRIALGNELDDVLRSHRLPPGPSSSLAVDDYETFIDERLQSLAEALAARAGSSGMPEELDPLRVRLDARIHTIELQLRELLFDLVDGESQRLPSHVTHKAIERVRAAARKQPGSDLQQPSCRTLLEYFDLRELQDALISKALWSEVEPSFTTKEQLNARFMQLAELRNTLRHSRTLSDVVLKDGEAAILWFNNALGDRQPASDTNPAVGERAS